MVTPDVDNRSLEVTAESGEYFRSSLIQLDGKEAPRTIAWSSRLPGGDYQVRGARSLTTPVARAPPCTSRSSCLGGADGGRLRRTRRETVSTHPRMLLRSDASTVGFLGITQTCPHRGERQTCSAVVQKRTQAFWGTAGAISID